jgi:hypothetical protein
MRQLPLLWQQASVRVLPATRAECEGEERPCPYVSCRYHLLLEARRVGKRGERIDVHPIAAAIIGERCDDWTDDDILTALLALPETCALDVADRGGVEQLAVGVVYGVGRTRVEALELEATARMRAALDTSDPGGQQF